VTVLPWLEREEFRERFASAGMIVFPSDFEGFGLPAVEAMRLEIPLVISPDEALIEATGGNATVVPGSDAVSLANGLATAWETPPEELERARRFVDGYRWVDAAAATREALAKMIGAASPGQPTQVESRF
jgi:glycosyltransferase involved in cell wall biosynthesis